MLTLMLTNGEQLEAARDARDASQPADAVARAREEALVKATEARMKVAHVLGNITARTAQAVRGSGGSTIRRVFKGWGREFAVDVPAGTAAAVMPVKSFQSLVNAVPGPLVTGEAEAFERLVTQLYEPADEPDEPMSMTS